MKTSGIESALLWVISSHTRAISFKVDTAPFCCMKYIELYLEVSSLVSVSLSMCRPYQLLAGCQKVICAVQLPTFRCGLWSFGYWCKLLCDVVDKVQLAIISWKRLENWRKQFPLSLFWAYMRCWTASIKHFTLVEGILMPLRLLVQSAARMYGSSISSDNIIGVSGVFSLFQT